MNSSALVVAALKQSPRGKLIYERQPLSLSIAHKSLRESTSSDSPQKVSNGKDQEVTTLAGSLADVSSVLEDVTTELSEIQLKRVASVISRLNSSARSPEPEISIDEDSENITSPAKEPHVSTPLMKKPASFDVTSPTIDEVMSIVGRELLKLESERKMKVELKIKERKMRLSARHEERKLQSIIDMEKAMQTVQSDLAFIEAKEKEAEANFSSKTNNDFLYQQELAARKAREAQIEAELQRAKQLELAKQEKQRKLQEEVIAQANNLNELLEPLVAIADAESINASLQPFGLSLESLPGFIHSSPTGSDLQEALEIIQELNTVVIELIDQATRQHEEKEALERHNQEQAELGQQKKQQELQLNQQQLNQQQKPQQDLITPQATIAETCQLSEISPANAELLKNVITFRDNYVRELNQMAVPKDFKFTCQKAVTTPLNAISDVSPEHLKDKLNKLTALTNGEPVQATETVRFQASSLPEMIYAKNHLAKKLVNHGEDNVASKSKNAFAPAIIIVSIWANHQDFGQAFLAYLYETCPFLVPKYPRKTKDTTDVDYLRALGYAIGMDGIAEDKTKFLKRVSGLTRLYTAITISRLPGSRATTQDHPHGLGNIWRLLASTLNLEPINDITATVLYDILSVSGAFMFEKYGPMFGKMLSVLATGYFQKITAVTEEGCGGPLARLELFLQKAISSQSIERPDGLLRADFL